MGKTLGHPGPPHCLQKDLSGERDALAAGKAEAEAAHAAAMKEKADLEAERARLAAEKAALEKEKADLEAEKARLEAEKAALEGDLGDHKVRSTAWGCSAWAA